MVVKTIADERFVCLPTGFSDRLVAVHAYFEHCVMSVLFDEVNSII